MGDEKLPFDLAGATAPSPVPLAHVPRFALGPLSIEPARRTIANAFGRSETVEPLVMQLLVTLRGALGSTLSRDDLIAACWDGRIVSDDAINRVVSKLRKVLAELGEGAVRLETVAKVGYRLAIREPAGADPVEARSGSEPTGRVPGRRWSAMALAAIGVAGVAALAMALAQPSREQGLTIGVESVLGGVGDRAAQRFAGDVTGDLTRFAGAMTRIDFIDNAASGGGTPDLVVRVAVDRQGAALSARARMVETTTGSVLWSREFRDEKSDAAQLRLQTAAGIAGAIRCGLERSAEAYRDSTSARLYLAACDALETKDWPRAEALAREIVTQHPDVAAGVACLAMTVLLATPNDARDRANRMAEAKHLAERALRLDPGIGRAYVVLAQIDPRITATALVTLERGIAADPQNRSLHSNYATMLFNAGYVTESVGPAQRALALDPASLSAHGAAVRRFLAAGRIGEAFAALAVAERLWPNNPEIVDGRVRLLPYRPDRSAARVEIERLAPAAELPALRRAQLLWKIDPAAIDMAQVEREAEADFAQNPETAWSIAGLMTRLGRTDRALAWLARAPRREAYNQWSLLFWPEAAPLRREPAFFGAMAELGLVELWRKRGKWPDFCSEPGLRYDCRTEAARLAAARSA